MTTGELENKLKISEKTWIHCPTLELAKQVLNIFHQLGLSWDNGTSYVLFHNWDAWKGKTLYYPFEGRLSALGFANLTGGYKVINAEEFIVLHTEEEEFDLGNYEPKGDLKGFPKEIIARMLECQEEQGNKRDVTVFEKHIDASKYHKGFNWDDTKEGYLFWYDVLDFKKFYRFFGEYPKKKTCSKCHKEKSLSEFHKKGNTVRSECKACRKQEYQELKNNKNMQANNKKEEDCQKFRVGDKVYDIAIGEIGIVKNINLNEFLNRQLEVYFKDNGTKFYTLEGIFYNNHIFPLLLHYRDDYNYSVIDFNNLPKRQEPKRWRAEEGGYYYFIGRDEHDFNLDKIYKSMDCYNGFSNDLYKTGNYFQTKEEAQEVADKINKYFQELIIQNK